MTKLTKVIQELKAELDKITLKQLADEKNVQHELEKVVETIGDFLSMINPHKRILNLKLSKKEE